MTRFSGDRPETVPEESAISRATRTDIQALRAFAVGAVVINHMWPGHLSGGYIGVDVFFVVSGFLITTHLMTEIARSSRLRFARFYARRARRLIPAATLVLVVSAVVGYLVLPYVTWERTGWEVLASALYVENWYLVSVSADYSALNDAATVAQHYWSLSVEEQFYLIWPALLILVWLAARKLGRGTARAQLTIVIGVIALVSLLSFLVGERIVSSGDPSGYFVTYGRIWEFGAGALVGLAAQRLRPGARLSAVLSAVGAVAIVGAAVRLDDTTPFPGLWALVPVLGTAAVIWAGVDRPRQWHDWLTSRAPVQWLGDVSYSLYLWHWPVIVLGPFVLGRPRSMAMSIGLLIVSLLLAELTRRWVENPLRSRASWVASPLRSLRAAAGLMAITAVAGYAIVMAYGRQDAAHRPPLDVAVVSCRGPNALSPGADCPDPFGPADSLEMTSRNEYFASPPECGDSLDRRLAQGDDHRTTRTCDFSGGRPDAPQVWLVGDSHAQQWGGLVFDLARERHWVVTTSFMGGCPPMDADFIGFRAPAPQDERERCEAWSQELSDYLVQDPPDLVFVSSASRLQTIDDGTGRDQVAQFTDSLQRVWSRWHEAGIRVVAIGDPPLTGQKGEPDCTMLSPDSPQNCAMPREVVQPPDPLILAAERTPGVEALDLTDYFCDAARCYTVIGGMPVYYDRDHLNLEYVRQFRDIVSDRLALDDYDRL